MNVIDSSHMEVIKNWLEDNPDHEFRIKSMGNSWVAILNRVANDETAAFMSGKTFGEAVKLLSNWIYEQRKT